LEAAVGRSLDGKAAGSPPDRLVRGELKDEGVFVDTLVIGVFHEKGVVEVRHR
jgi:hypothetical protein